MKQYETREKSRLINKLKRSIFWNVKPCLCVCVCARALKGRISKSTNFLNLDI